MYTLGDRQQCAKLCQKLESCGMEESLQGLKTSIPVTGAEGAHLGPLRFFTGI